jgi:hypothetical protein
MDELSDKIKAAKSAEQARTKQEERIPQVALSVFRTEDGKELLAHLIKRFDLAGRIFIVGDKGEVNALRAAIRDGERACVRHLLDLCRKADKDFPIPL